MFHVIFRAFSDRPRIALSVCDRDLRIWQKSFVSFVLAYRCCERRAISSLFFLCNTAFVISVGSVCLYFEVVDKNIEIRFLIISFIYLDIIVFETQVSDFLKVESSTRYKFTAEILTIV